MKTAKLGALFMVSLMALAGFGVSYAAWFDEIDINATATTGNLEYRITNFALMDQTTIGGSDPITWTGVGSYGGEPDSITVTVAPTYPGWEAICQLTVKNTGDLPLELYSIQMTRDSGDANLMDYYYYAIPDGINLPPPNTHFINNLAWWTTERTYSYMAISIIIQPGSTETLEAYFWLHPDVPQQWEGQALTITLTVKATTAPILP